MGYNDAYRFEAIAGENRSRASEAALLRLVFPHATQFSPEFLSWEYDANPSGTAVGYDAYAGSALCAHYATQPLDALLFGTPARGLLSFNTATHPDHQGRGLFTTLAQRTYDLARASGYEFVVGVANQQSTPGFIGKLGFQLVSPLRVFVGIGLPDDPRPTPVDYARVWNERSRSWRELNPVKTYHSVRGRLACATGVPLVKAMLTTTAWGGRDRTRAMFNAAHPFTIWMGLRQNLRWRGLAAPLPRALRPSPLNLIFLDLSGQARRLEPNRVAFDAVDFDAY